MDYLVLAEPWMGQTSLPTSCALALNLGADYAYQGSSALMLANTLVNRSVITLGPRGANSSNVNFLVPPKVDESASQEEITPTSAPNKEPEVCQPTEEHPNWGGPWNWDTDNCIWVSDA